MANTNQSYPVGGLDVLLTPINYIPSSSGNTNNRGQIVTDPNGDVWAIDDDGEALKLNSAQCISYMKTETFIASAGQTSFTLANPASGDVRISRNGATLADAAATVSGNIVTYVSSANNNEAFLVNDRIEISYIYVVCM